MGDTVHPLPPDGVEASALYPEVKFTTLESYLTQLAQKGTRLKAYCVHAITMKAMCSCSHVHVTLQSLHLPTGNVPVNASLLAYAKLP